MRVVAAPWVLLGSRSLSPRAAGGEGRGEGGASPLTPALSPQAGRGGSIQDAALALDGDVVAAVGPRAEVEARFGPAERVDAVLLPALVNAHTHLELSHLQNAVPGGEGLADWVRVLVAVRANRPDPGAALDEAVLRLAEAGVAAVGEVTNGLAALPALRRAGLAGTLFHEVFGFAPARIDSALARAREAREAAGDPGPGLHLRPSAHAVYSTHPPVAAALLSAGPSSIHLAEDPQERRFCAFGDGPFANLNRMLGADVAPFARSPVAAVAPFLRPDTLCVHCVDVDDEDLALLARSGATAVLCPRSNLHIGGRLPDVERLLAAGVPLAIGTDSLASSPSLSPLAELAVLARAFPAVPAATLLALAWNGAAVGAPGVGRLAPGAAPGVLAAPLRGARPADPARWLLDEHGERPLDWLARHRPEGGLAGRAEVPAA
jgi:cytosine/adenosine deaminase-related metal-dependent hydrolase